MSWIRDLDSGRYQAIYRDGKGRQRSRSFERKKDARAWLAAQELSLARGQWTDPRAGEVAFRDFVKRWQAGREVEMTSDASDRGRIENHLLPAFGDWPLSGIRYTDVTDWMASLTRKGLAPKTRRECLALLKMILAAAVLDGVIPANPAASVKPPPKARVVQREVSLEEVEAVLAKATSALKPRVAFAAYTGARWGEICGLRWGSLDLRRRRVGIVETMVELDGKFHRKPYPKDRESRLVPIVEPLAAILTEYATALPAKPSAHDLVFPAKGGGPIYRSNNGRSLDLACRKAGVPPFDFKDLRRFCASYLINVCGVPVTVVRELLGHSKASMTLDVYTAAPTDWHATVAAAFAVPEQTADEMPIQAAAEA